MLKKTVIVFGYNNSRLYDIERIKLHCIQLNAELLLCKESILLADKLITPYTLQVNLSDYDLETINNQIQLINDYLNARQLKAIACLPFADKGIPLGSYYAESLGLPHDDSARAIACVDKYIFRQYEAEAATPDWYKKPFFMRIYSFQQAEEIVQTQKKSLFFKPSKEGNSRGCIAINSLQDLIINKPILDNYFEQGIIIEECIKDCDEYSFDGVNGCYVITEKKTSSGYFRVETQHILPAPLNEFHYQRLLEAGKIVATISGSNKGAVHHELFMNKKTGDVYCVEPNRRPGGLKLWDWIAAAYPGTQLWDSWLAWSFGEPHMNYNTQDAEYYVGCRMLQAERSGIIAHVNEASIHLLRQQEDVLDVTYVKSLGNSVTALLRDNSDFLGYVVCRGKTPEQLNEQLNKVTQAALDACIITRNAA